MCSYLPDFIYSPLQKHLSLHLTKLQWLETQLEISAKTFPLLRTFFLNNCVVLGDDLKKLVGKEVIEKSRGAPLLFIAAVISGGFLTFKKCVSLKLFIKATASVQNILNLYLLLLLYIVILSPLLQWQLQ